MAPDAGNVALEDALLDAFSLNSMTRMLRRQLGIVLERELDLHQGTKFIFGDLVAISIKEGWRDDLVRAARADSPKNPQLKKAAAALNISLPTSQTDVPKGSIRVSDLDQPRLEKMARERGVTVSFEEYSTKLTALAHQMCRIEIPTGSAFGTGWLVGPDLVLTNYHVIEEVEQKAVAAADVTCRFDYFVDESDGVPCGLAARWLEDWSPYADADERADAPDPTPEQLDYALIRLSRAVGDEKASNGAKRCWVRVAASPPAVIAEDIVMVPQFPDDRSLELSFGKALQYNDAGTRLRYDANTEEGASGSPAVTMAIEPFGLHHAGGPGRTQKYNQCVPLRLVIQRMVRLKIPQWWAVV